MYVLPNRKAFADSITRIFLKYRKLDVDPLDTADSEEDLCLKQGDMSRNSKELFSYQKIVRDYLLMETPYRGLLLYHGLGSGKTCSSIAVAESLLSNKKVYVLLPASLEANYKGEIRKCGDPIYMYEQYWETKFIRTPEDREQAKGMGISDDFLDKNNGRYFVNVSGRVPNYKTLDTATKKSIASQIDDMLDSRFHFIRYNGLTKDNIEGILPPDEPHIFDNCVIIIDEAHNLIGSVVNESDLRKRLYDRIYSAKNTKVVCLSGTPVVNRPIEIAFLMNLLRGPIERIIIPTKSAVSWDEGLMTAYFRSLKDVDTIEYNSVKRTFMLTRNPPFFESVYNEKGERIAVKYNKEFDQEPDIKKWVNTWKTQFETKFGGIEIAEPEKMFVEELTCLPTDFEEFAKTFLDGLSIKNPILFARRIQGLISYFKGADERLLPKLIEEEQKLVKIPMSDEQYLRYLEVRWEEVQSEASKKRRSNLNDDFGSYRVGSRLACNYAIPPEFRTVMKEGDTEETIVPKPEIIEKLKADAKKYLSEDGLKIYSPKMLKMLQEIKANVGNPGAFRNQLVYSQYRSLEGLGVFAAILEANGFQRYRVVQKNGIWQEDESMKKDVPAFATYTGEESSQERELYREIFNFNGQFSDTFPASLRETIKEKRLCVFMISKAGAEGITLANVRNVYIMEPYWNPALIDQVIGRAVRICSHATLPLAERTVKVQYYLTVFTPEQMTSAEGPNIVSIRRNDTVLKRYDEPEPRQVFMSSDEYLYEVAYEKGRVIKNISLILKQAAIDCEIHRKLHAKEVPVIQCMRFDSTVSPEDLGYNPSIKRDERDELTMRNILRKARRLQIIRAKGILLVLDPDSNEVFDYPAFQDTKKLILLGTRISAGEIRFFPPLSVEWLRYPRLAS